MPTPDAMLFDFSDRDWHFGLAGAVRMANAYVRPRRLQRRGRAAGDLSHPSPQGHGHVGSASFLNNSLTAQNALDTFALPPGSTLLVTGAASGVAGYLTQLGTTQGLRVIAAETLHRNMSDTNTIARNTLRRRRSIYSEAPVARRSARYICRGVGGSGSGCADWAAQAWRR